MKIFEGIVVSISMNNTAVIEVSRRTPHPLYKKLIRRSKKLKADTLGQTVIVGNTVRITETRPISKDKYFKITQIIGSRHIKNEKQYLKSEKAEVVQEDLDPAKKETVKKVRKTARKGAK